MKKLASLFLAIVLFAAAGSTATAQSLSVSGQVVSTGTENVLSGYGGTVDEIFVSAGDTVRKGETLATLKAGGVYAQTDGTVHFFGSVGDDAAAVSEQYGAVVWIEPVMRYSISASTKYAYAADENKIIHPGETVYLREADSALHTGIGRVTSVSGTSYSVELSEANLESGKIVYLYRKAEYGTKSRIGRATVELKDPVACTAEGIISSIAAEDGALVKKGDLLFETLEGSYTGKTSGLTAITAPSDGVVSSVSVSKGAAISSGTSAAEIYPDAGMRVEANVAESELHLFRPGNTVTIELNYLEDGGVTVSGTIEKVSRIGTEDGSEESGEAQFSVLILPEKTENLLYGLHAMITASDDSAAPEEETEAP